MRVSLKFLLGLFIVANTTQSQTRNVSYSLPYDTARGGLSINYDWMQEIEPDVATITLSVDAQRSDLRSASEQNKLLADKILDALKNYPCSLRFDPAHTLSVPSTNAYSGYSNSITEPDYVVSRTAVIMTPIITSYPDIMRALSQINGMTINRIDFSTSKMDSLGAEALKNAQTVLRKKAEEAGKTLGFKPGKLYSFSYAAPQLEPEYAVLSYPISSPSQIQPMSNQMPHPGKLLFKITLSGMFEITP
ncbi:MAG TPA: SIMPL domain-containing protein [bacterium]|nr:SIMPL domain-containing protein [bacterium]HMW32156.1 SIMPL domain-containing protein [bacterium]HMW35558.1 SIMPL domain-containing protein [bacterium]HMY34801.1 SIMPL domain-containing protein [bacterium]HMZ03918.1 SIMPL domain-containing protein [bacterium]